MKAKRLMSKTVKLEGASVEIEGKTVKIKGEKGELTREFKHPKVDITKEESNIKVTSKKQTRHQKKIINAIAAHISNMIEGLKKPHVYKLKVCSSHFPMNVTFKNNTLEVKNFLGEKETRTLKVPEGVNVKLQGQELTVESADKEAAGRTASDMEQLCRITNKDRRIFQDGIYITKKAK